LTAFIYLPKTAVAGTSSTQYLRIHIRANSNTEYDQQIKYTVRDAIVQALTPLVNACATKPQAELVLQQNIPFIEQTANSVLAAYGYSYRSKASLRSENFPTRVYENLTLPEGVYDALIVELGEGKGDNWWCVIYPPLCFTGESAVAGNVVYKSKIAELIAQLKK
jgi:stage II sporulation protein R